MQLIVGGVRVRQGDADIPVIKSEAVIIPGYHDRPAPVPRMTSRWMVPNEIFTDQDLFGQMIDGIYTKRANFKRAQDFKLIKCIHS